jgi:phage terminase large subunit GpA-like protein
VIIEPVLLQLRGTAPLLAFSGDSVHDFAPTPDQREWLAQQFDELPSEHIVVAPSAWAEERRYLPASVTSLPGPYRFDVVPYLREVLDCLSIDSPIREVVIQKGAQIGATVGVLENAIGYFIDHVRCAPCMLVTADAELAKLRMDSYVIPMLQSSRLDHLITSHDELSDRKSGKTEKKLEWKGGGFLIPFGAQSANKLRSISIQMLLRDEIDGWPDVVGKDGDPLKLVGDRTAAYELSRKILDISTPTVKGSSKIEKRFAAGDQRYYFVCCLKCGFPQRLRWRSLEEGGVVTGIVWETESGRLVQESVRWCCSNCHAAHTNDDKTRLLSPAHGAEWRPTAVSSSPSLRSYHLSALYSPVGMQSWASCVAKWLDAWDPERNRPRDTRQLQVFYNNVLGDPFEIRGERVRFEAVSGHRRSWYLYCTPDDPTTLPNLIPNTACVRYCGSPVLFLTATVDVHSDNLKVAVWGWCRDRRVLLLDYFTFEGDTEQMEAPPWKALRSLIEDKRYESDDGRAYALGITLIDSGYRTDLVYRFCAEYDAGVFPVKGREVSPRNQRDKEFSEFTTPTGQRAYGITVDFYKDRWSAALKVEWDASLGIQPVGHFNAPQNATDKQLRELTAETKVARVDARTGERIGWEWRRPSGAANELWDLLVYGNAAVDLVAWHYCRDQLELEQTNWPAFWDAMVADVTGSG